MLAIGFLSIVMIQINQIYLRDVEFKLFDETSWYKSFVIGGNVL